MDETLDLPIHEFPLKKKAKKPKPSIEDQQNDITPPDPDKQLHTYIELLDRVFVFLRQNNPHYDTPQTRLQVPIPQLAIVGSKRSMWINFTQTCEILQRLVDHVQSFFLSELCTTGSLDVNGRLLMQGRFRHNHIEPVLKKYILGYVACDKCRQLDTTLTKDPVSRLMFLECSLCFWKRPVQPIQAGFVKKL